MKPTVGTRVMSEGKTGTVMAHRPGEMVDVRWDDRKYDVRTDYKTLAAVRSNSGAKFKPVFVAAVLDDVAKQDLYNYWMAQTGAPRPLPVPKMSHMTIKFRPSAEEVASMPIGQPVKLRVVGWAANDLIQAVAVEPVGVGSANAAPHVTFALADASVAPKLSNDLFAGAATSGQKALGPVLTATLGWSDGGGYHFSVPGMASNPGPRGGLTQGERTDLPASDFALPGRRFPINDRRHAVIAMQYILRGFVRPEDIEQILSAIAQRYPQRDRKNAEIWAFYKKHQAKLAPRVAANPKEDAYDPAKEQFRAVVQGVYESQVRKELGLPYNTPFDSAGRRLDSSLDEDTKRRLLSSAYAIATRQGQRQGYLQPGTQKPTERGLARSAERLSEQEHAGQNRQDYERTLAAVRKSGHYRVVEERTESNRRVFVVRPRPPKNLIKIPDYRLTQESAEQDARAAEAALSKAPSAVRAKANPYYVKDSGYALTTTDIEDEPGDLTPKNGETFADFEARIGVPPEALAELGEWRGRVDTGDWLSPIPEAIRKIPLTRAKIIEDFERFQYIAPGSRKLEAMQQAKSANKPIPSLEVKPAGEQYFAARGGTSITVSPGQTLHNLLEKGTARDKLALVQEAMADNVLEHYRFGSLLLPPIREVYYTQAGQSVSGEDREEMRDYNQYDHGYSLYSRHGWMERYRDDFVQGLRAFISLLRTGKMPEGQEAMGDKFVFETGTPEPYSPVQLSQLAALPPPEGQPAVETIAKNGMDYLKKNLYRLRIPRGLERALFISPSALRLGVAADMANVISLHNGLVALLANVDDYATRAELQAKLVRPRVASSGKSTSFADTSNLSASAYHSPAWTFGTADALPPKLLGEYRGALQGEMIRDQLSKRTGADDLPVRYEAGDTPEMRYRAFRAVPPTHTGMDELSLMQGQQAVREGERMIRDARLLATTALADRQIAKPDNTEAMEQIAYMEARSAEMLAAGQARLERGQLLEARGAGTMSKTMGLWAQVPAIAKRVYNDVVAASSHASWHFNFYRVAQADRGLVEGYIGRKEELEDGDLRVFITNGSSAVKKSSPPFKVTYKFDRKAERDAFVEQFLRPRVQERTEKAENELNVKKAERALALAIKNYDFAAVTPTRTLTYAEIMRGEQAKVASDLLRISEAADQVLSKFKRDLPPLDEREGFDWERQVILDHAAAVNDRARLNASLPPSSALPSIAPLTADEAEVQALRRRNDFEKLLAESKRGRSIDQYASSARTLAELRVQAQDRLGGVQMTDTERALAVADLTRRITSTKAKFDRMYATEKAQGKHEVASELRDLRGALAAVDPNNPMAAEIVDYASAAAERLAEMSDRPYLTTLQEAAIFKATGARPVFKHGFYAPRQSELDPPQGVWVPGRYVGIDGELNLPPAGLSAIEKFLERVERGVIQQERREADSLPYVMAVMPSGISSLNCGPVAINSHESVPRILLDPKAAIPGVKYNASFADHPSMLGHGQERYPDSVVAFAYLLNQNNSMARSADGEKVRSQLYDRLRRAFGSPAVQEITRQHFRTGEAAKIRRLKEAFDAFVSRQAVNFRFATPQEITGLGNSEEAKKLKVASRGLPMAAYLYAGIPASEAREYAAPAEDAAPIFNGPIKDRAALAARLLLSHRDIMRKHPRLPGTASLHRKPDGSPFIYVHDYPETAASKAKYNESAKNTFIQDTSLRTGADPVPLSAMAKRPPGWTPPVKDERPTNYRRTLTPLEKTQMLMRADLDDITRQQLSADLARAAAEEDRQTTLEMSEINRRKSDADKSKEIADYVNSAAMDERNADNTYENDIVSKTSALGRADAIDTLAGRNGDLRVTWFSILAGLKGLLRGKSEYADRVAELEDLANTGSADALASALIDFTSSLQGLPTKTKGDIEVKIRNLQGVVRAAKHVIEDPDVPQIQQAAAFRVGKKAKSVPARRAQTMNIYEEQMPPVFWDIEFDPYDAKNPEVYVLYVNTKKYQRPKFAKTLAGDLVRRDLPNRMVRTKGGVGGGLATAGLYGQTQEVVQLGEQIAHAQATGDKQAEKAARGRMREINKYARDFRDAGRLYVSNLVVEGRTDPLEAIQKRLAAFRAPTAGIGSDELTEGQKTIYRAAAAASGKSYQDIVNDALLRRKQAAAASRAVGAGDVSENKEISWVYQRKFGRVMRSANKVWDPDGGKYQKFKFSIADYARFVTKNPQVLLATVRYWDAPQLVTGTTLYLPGGRFIQLPGAFEETEGPGSGYALPSDPSAMLTELIEEYKGHYLQAVRDGDVVAQAEIVKILFGNESNEGMTEEEKDTEGLVNIASRFHSALGYTLPGKNEVPAVSGVIGGVGKFTIESASPVGLRAYGRYTQHERVPFAETRAGQLMAEDVKLAVADGIETRGRTKDASRRSLRTGTAQSEGTAIQAVTAFGQGEQELTAQTTSIAVVQPALALSPGARIRLKGGRFANAEGFVARIEPGPSGTKNIILLLDPYRNKTAPFETAVNSMAASSIEVIEDGGGARSLAPREEEEPRRQTPPETRKAAATRTEAARSTAALKYFAGQRVIVMPEGEDEPYIADVISISFEDGRPMYKLEFKFTNDGQDFKDKDGNPIILDVSESEIIQALGEGVGDSGEEVIGNPRARQRAQRAQKNGTLRSRTYNAARLMPMVFE